MRNPGIASQHPDWNGSEVRRRIAVHAGPLFFEYAFLFTTFVALRRVPRGSSQEVGMPRRFSYLSEAGEGVSFVCIWFAEKSAPHFLEKGSKGALG